MEYYLLFSMTITALLLFTSFLLLISKKRYKPVSFFIYLCTVFLFNGVFYFASVFINKEYSPSISLYLTIILCLFFLSIRFICYVLTLVFIENNIIPIKIIFFLMASIIITYEHSFIALLFLIPFYFVFSDTQWNQSSSQWCNGEDEIKERFKVDESRGTTIDPFDEFSYPETFLDDWFY